MNQATIGQHTYPVAGRFDELTPRQFTAVVGLLHTELPKLDLKLRLTLVLLDVAKRPLLYRQLHRMSDEQRYELTVLADFCLQEPRLTKQLLPVLAGPLLTRLYGPADGFSNLTFAEFIQAEGHFADYQRQRGERHLDQLVATLYRPAGKGSSAADRRQAFEPREVAGRLRAVTRLPLATRQAVALWYGSCRAAWVKQYQGTLFTVQEPGSQAPPPRDVRATWRDILAERAGSPVQYDEYGRQPLPNVLFDLDLRIRRRLDEKAAIQSAR